MKQFFISIILVFVFINTVDADWYYAGSSVEAEAYCGGSELFCEDFEGTDTTWTVGAGTLDCDGYDTAGDYCDDDTTYFKNGTEGLAGLGGGAEWYFYTAISTTQEFYMEWWYRTSTDVTDAPMRFFVNSGSSTVETCYGYINSTSYLRVITNDGATALNATTQAFSAESWYHVGIYYKEETAPADNDGIVRAWINTDGSTFDSGDVVINSEAVDTGNFDGNRVYFKGQNTGLIHAFDDAQVVQGAPSWTY